MSSRANLRWSALVILAAGLIHAGPFGVFAQTTEAVCLSSFDWMDNSKSQSPCLIAAYLQGACNGGQWNVGALPPDEYYIGPFADESNPCQCSSVTYSTISACGFCQNRTIIGWSTWKTNCTIVYPEVFGPGVPSGTAVPQWAYQDVTSSDFFNLTLAQAVGDNPESTASISQSTATAVTSTSTVPASVSLTTLPSTSSAPGPVSSQATSSVLDVSAVVGGIVGGIVGLALIAAVAVWYKKKRRSQILPSAQLNNFPPSPGYPLPSGPNTDPNPFVTQMAHPKLYDPSDPSTFPVSPPPNTITTLSSQNITNSNISHSNPSMRPGEHYNSVPEI